MSGFNISQNPEVSTTVKKPRMINPNRQQSSVLHPPRLKQLKIGMRDYTKPELPAEDPMGPGSKAGFGQLGMSGET